MQDVLPHNQCHCRVGDTGAAGLVQDPARARDTHLRVTSPVSLTWEQRHTAPLYSMDPSVVSRPVVS